MRPLKTALFVMSFVLIVLSNTIQAQDVTVTTKTKANYLGGDGAVFYDGPVQQTDAFLSWKNGIYADIWTSTSFNAKKNFGKEVDFTLGKSGKLGEFGYSADINYFAIIITDVANTNAELSRSFQLNHRTNLTPFIRGEYYFPVQKGGPRRGVMGVVGAKSNINLAPRLVLTIKAQLKKDSGAFGFNSALLGQGRADLTLVVSGRFSILGSANFSTPLSHVTDSRKTQATWEFGVSYRLK